MKFKFLAAYCVYGMTMPKGGAAVTIFQGDGLHVFLTSDVNTPLQVLDRQRAIARVALSPSVGHAFKSTPKETWMNHVHETQQARRSRQDPFGFLVVEVDGDVSVSLPNRLALAVSESAGDQTSRIHGCVEFVEAIHNGDGLQVRVNLGSGAQGSKHAAGQTCNAK